MAERGEFFKESIASQPKRGWHNLSFDNTFTCNSGDLYPTKFLEVFPGDVIHDSSSSMARLMPLVAPVMGKLNIFSYHFIVRNRDIWTQWDKFITNYDQKRTWQQNANFIAPVMPFIKVNEILYGPIFNFAANPSTFADFQNVWYLCQFEFNGNCMSIITSVKQMSIDIFNDSSYSDRRIYTLIPNKDDDFGLSRSANNVYNPFSPGSLLEFLGVNIDGFFKQQIPDLRLLIGNASGVMQNDSIFWDEYTDSVSDGFNQQNTYSDWISFVPTTEWMESHQILSYSQFGDDADNVSHWLADGTHTQSGAASLNVSWINAPFNPSDADRYDFELSALPIRAYRFVYDEYFRDENYIDVNPNTDFSRDGNDLDWQNVSWLNIYRYLTFERKAYEHDLYTTALPSAQRGKPVQYIPNSPLTVGDSITAQSGSKYDQVRFLNGSHLVADNSQTTTTATYKELVVDMSAATIESLRFFNSMQRYLELKARTGGRYFEYMLGQWGVEIPDSKINRPIYLNGDRVPVQISEVTQTSSSNVETGQPLGDLAGRGVAIGEDQRIDFTAPDHGFLIELCVVVPRTAYGQGIKPMFKRFNFMDYPLPSFANLGEEPVRTRELYATLVKQYDDATFGYQSRYYQFKYERDQIHSSMLTDLRHWTFARLFDGVPYNGKDFLQVDPSYRQFAVTSENYDHFLVTMWHDIQINRALPELSIPSL